MVAPVRIGTWYLGSRGGYDSEHGRTTIPLCLFVTLSMYLDIYESARWLWYYLYRLDTGRLYCTTVFSTGLMITLDQDLA